MLGDVEDLAIFGGLPEFDPPRYVGLPNVGDRAALFALLDGVLDRRWLSNGGPLVQEFERRVADLAGVRYCVATANATVALELAIRATDMSGEVIVPAFTFAATVHAVRWMGLTPVLCDVDPESGNLDPERVAERVTARTGGVIGVHLWGRPCAVDELTELADRHGLPLLFDAAQAFGARYRDRPVGGFGAAEVFSFHATKLVNAFEGGAVVTDDGGVAARVRAMHNFGIVGDDEVALVGTNGKMSEAAAAMGLVSLAGLPSFVERDQSNHRRYRQVLDGLPGLTLLPPDPHSPPSYHHVVVRVDRDVLGLGRDELMAVLRAEGVMARRYFYPGCHRMAPYTVDPGIAGAGAFPHTEALADTVLSLPTGAAVDDRDIARVAGLLGVAAAHAPAVRSRLGLPGQHEAAERGQSVGRGA